MAIKIAGVFIHIQTNEHFYTQNSNKMQCSGINGEDRRGEPANSMFTWKIIVKTVCTRVCMWVCGSTVCPRRLGGWCSRRSRYMPNIGSHGRPTHSTDASTSHHRHSLFHTFHRPHVNNYHVRLKYEEVRQRMSKRDSYLFTWHIVRKCGSVEKEIVLGTFTWTMS